MPPWKRRSAGSCRWRGAGSGWRRRSFRTRKPSRPSRSPPVSTWCTGPGGWPDWRTAQPLILTGFDALRAMHCGIDGNLGEMIDFCVRMARGGNMALAHASVERALALARPAPP